MKIKSLVIGFENIAICTAQKKWIFICCRNQFVLDEIHEIVYELVANVRAFAFNLFEDEEDFESAPPAHTKKASIKSLEYLHSDLQLLLDIFYKRVDKFFGARRSTTRCIVWIVSKRNWHNVIDWI